MTGIDLLNHMSESIMSLPKPDAELQVSEVKDLEETFKMLAYEAKGHSCKHPPEHVQRIAAGEFCYQCGRVVGP